MKKGSEKLTAEPKMVYQETDGDRNALAWLHLTLLLQLIQSVGVSRCSVVDWTMEG